MVSEFKEMENSLESWNVTGETTKYSTFRVEKMETSKLTGKLILIQVSYRSVGLRVNS